MLLPSLRTVFMGTPAFAVPALQMLHQANIPIAAVYTQPPRPAGRGMRLTPSPVETCARALGLPVETPLNFRDPATVAHLRDYHADILIVAAYGLLLPTSVLTAAPRGAINIHPSLLPRWRGAAPIHRPLLAGEAETGVTIMQMDEGLDTGPVLTQETCPITPTTTYAALHDHLAVQGAELLVKTLLQLDHITPMPQEDAQSCYAAKLRKEEGWIDFTTDDIYQIDRKIRALNPWPGTRCTLRGEEIKILQARMDTTTRTILPGTILNTELHIACIGGILYPEILQRPGKAALPVEAFAKGF